MSISTQQLKRAAGSRKVVLQPKDFADLGIHPEQVSRLVRQGGLIRIGRGRYLLAQSDYSENLGFALVASAVPNATICLLSALRFHDIGTQAPYEVWIAVARGATVPRIDYPKVRVAVFSGRAFEHGMQRHVIDGVNVRIYSPAKTVADCFKFRNKIGLDVAIEALRDGLGKKLFTRDELWVAAKVCRVTASIGPYLDVL